jgi:hypothetical protein
MGMNEFMIYAGASRVDGVLRFTGLQFCRHPCPATEPLRQMSFSFTTLLVRQSPIANRQS